MRSPLLGIGWCVPVKNLSPPFATEGAGVGRAHSYVLAPDSFNWLRWD